MRVPGFNQITNVVLVSVALLVAGLSIHNHFFRASGQSVAGRANVESGERAPTLTGVDYTAFRRSVVVYVHSRCEYCTRSMPLYKALLTGDSTTQVVVASREPEELTRSYFETYGLSPKTIAVVGSGGDQRLTVTPTVFSVSSAGLVERVWVGLLDRAAEQAVKETVFGGGSARGDWNP
jgi:hypothetical protein